MSGINETLNERGARYGAFSGHSQITQEIKTTMRNADNWSQLRLSQKEALEMIAHKIGRIINGDSNYVDSWNDIAVYATLVEQELTK